MKLVQVLFISVMVATTAGCNSAKFKRTETQMLADGGKIETVSEGWADSKDILSSRQESLDVTPNGVKWRKSSTAAQSPSLVLCLRSGCGLPQWSHSRSKWERHQSHVYRYGY